MNKKIAALVVNPYVTDFKLYDEWMHPLGLYFLMDILIYNNIKVYYFNCLQRNPKTISKFGTGKFEHTYIPKPFLYRKIKRRYKRYGCSLDTFEDYLKTISKIDIVFVGSMMTYWIGGVIETVEIIRKYFPDKPIVCGGIAAKLIPDYIREKIKDIHIFDRSILTKDDKFFMPGLAEPLILPPSPEITSCLTKETKYFHGPIILSLGCPFNCSYCASKILQPQRHLRDLETIKKEFMFFYNLGVRDFAFYDDALLYEKEKTLVPLLNWVEKSKIDVRFHTPNGMHLKYIDESILELMYKCGFTTLRFGYESGSKKYQKDTDSKATREMVKEKLSLLKRWNFPNVGVYVMAGLPSSSPAEIIEEMEFINSCGVFVKPVFLSPVPKTPLFNYYSSLFPEIKKDPLWHNDTFFITQLKDWGEEEVEMVREKAKELNKNIVTTNLQ